jgi:hypothetical protein
MTSLQTHPCARRNRPATRALIGKRRFQLETKKTVMADKKMNPRSTVARKKQAVIARRLVSRSTARIAVPTAAATSRSLYSMGSLQKSSPSFLSYQPWRLIVKPHRFYRQTCIAASIFVLSARGLEERMSLSSRRAEEATETHTYQIFRRAADNTTVCVESVKGLRFAQARVQDLDAPTDATH